MILSDSDLALAFAAHAHGQTHFTRRMVITLADIDGSTPRALVRRCERLGLLKSGSWEWFVANGGITPEQVDQVRRENAGRRALAKAEGK